jgi:site-specific recombinase XerD
MTKPTTPLRQRMIEDMAIRNLSPLTQAAYVRAVANFAIHHGVSPDKLTFEDVRMYQVHLIGRGLKVATIIPIMCALRFLYGTTLGLKDVSEQIPLPRKDDTLPTVLSRDEVVRFLNAVTDLRMRTIFITIYAAGLRVSEVVKLTAADINSQRMVLHIRQAKGRKDRYACCPSSCWRSYAITSSAPSHPSPASFLARITKAQSPAGPCSAPAARRPMQPALRRP